MHKRYSDLQNPLHYLIIKDKCCANCLYSPRRLTTKETATRIQSDCRAQDKVFFCHKATYEHDDMRVVCRAFYESNKDMPSIRLAHALQRRAGEPLIYSINLDTGDLTPER